MSSLALKIAILILTSLEAAHTAPAAKQAVRTQQVHHYTAKCYKVCSRSLHF